MFYEKLIFFQTIKIIEFYDFWQNIIQSKQIFLKYYLLPNICVKNSVTTNLAIQYLVDTLNILMHGRIDTAVWMHYLDAN